MINSPPGDSTIDDLNDQVQARLNKLQALRERNENPYKNGLAPKDLASALHAAYDSKSKEELDALSVACSVAGRVMAIRSFGKAAFVQLKDRTGVIQLFVQKKVLGDEKFQTFKELDVGDILFGSGQAFKTKTNELSVNCTELVLASKSLRPLPEKFHGVSDIEIRYRQRYLDLTMSEASRKVFEIRSAMIDSIRRFFKEHDFIEVETPMMHPIAGGAAAKPFKTFHNTLSMELFLRIAPELYLKRLVVGGMDRVFEINRNFRNEGISIKHNPEFTMLEFYQAWSTYEDLMTFTEELFQRVAQEVLGETTITYEDTPIVLGGKWERISVEDSIMKYSTFQDRSKLRDREALLAHGKSAGYHMDPKSNTGELMMAVFDEEVESKLIQPTFVTQYPLDVSPLSRKNESDPFLVDRFELFIYGREMANAFSELNDPIDQKDRFQAQVASKAAGNEEACDMDEDYVRALEYGMPPTAGEGIGIDRMAMLFTNSSSIRDVILFPLLRPQGGEK